LLVALATRVTGRYDVPTHSEDKAANVEMVMPTHLHLPSAYFRELRALGFDVDAGA